MDNQAMIEDLVKLLDEGVSKGVGHINVEFNADSKALRRVETTECTDCSKTPLACSVPTLMQGLDDYQ